MHLPFVTMDLWTILFTLGNTLILYLIVKKLLFKPVKKMIDARAREVEETYQRAHRARTEAESAKQEYTSQISSAKMEAQALLKDASAKAQSRSEQILEDAKQEASHLMRRARKELEREKQRAIHEMKDEISDMAVQLATKIVRREITPEDQDRLLEEFLKEEEETPWPKQ